MFEEIPKILAMILNNEKIYNTSEKSARYTHMEPSEDEKALYEKWIEIYKTEISKKYPKEKYSESPIYLYKREKEDIEKMVGDTGMMLFTKSDVINLFNTAPPNEPVPPVINNTLPSNILFLLLNISQQP